ncbi:MULTISPECIES: TetR/AcrR family transcriptional regulator [Paraburkholderia]|jgi:TetR/AcrR family transcriptional repressor of nem operon|uniref:Transcriptional regulator, TetR family n=1 Tax=Paraburkholderia phenazinium TaxID=60549 RepID=A0A1N6JEC3_9BURK|nr:TetR/AcrR family transcriptional regulator [Paraburkholderia phenazinium]SIO42724.1 transcriptional regulator, TetR family [Paraburkholderia phenazinium]
MGYSQAQKAESRQRVLENASRQIRENGIEALGVADCMRSAGLTHGAFYGHFASRDALIVEALEYALTQSRARIAARDNDAGKRSETPLQSIAEAFLDERHVNDPGTGCALCALAGEARHANADVRALLTRYLNELTARVAKAALRGGEKSALGIVATIVGAITLARAVDDDELAKSVLSSSLALVMTQDGDGDSVQ